jgi:hypothetical protein
MADLPDADHILIIQDDAMPVPGFAAAVNQIAEAHPGAPVCLYLARYPRDTKPRAELAMKMNRRYVMLSWRCFMPIVAVLWPREKLVEFAAWAEDNPYLLGRADPRSDDAMAGRWKLVNRETVLATIPSLVEHPDQEPSTIGRTSRQGRDRGRCAMFLATDALDYDWTMP